MIFIPKISGYLKNVLLVAKHIKSAQHYAKKTENTSKNILKYLNIS